MKLLKIGLLVLISLLLTFCSSQETVFGNGVEKTKIITPKAFEKITTFTNAKITINEGDKFELILNGDSNIIDNYLEIDVVKNDCIIKLKNGSYRDYRLHINITLPKISGIKTLGSGAIHVNDFSNQSNMNLSLVGSGNIYINKINPMHQLQAAIVGSGDIIFKENITINNIKLQLVGSGKYNGYKVNTQNYSISLPGSGDVELYASSKLNASVPGSGDIFYKGNPKISFSSSGSGRLINAN